MLVDLGRALMLTLTAVYALGGAGVLGLWGALAVLDWRDGFYSG